MNKRLSTDGTDADGMLMPTSCASLVDRALTATTIAFTHEQPMRWLIAAHETPDPNSTDAVPVDRASSIARHCSARSDIPGAIQ